jgi:hypothetical protein
MNKPTCARCNQSFDQKRTDQRFCSKSCARAASRNATRGQRTLAHSGEARRTHETRCGRVRGLSNAFYETPPTYRAAFLERLIAEGRGNADLRRLVTLRDLLRSWARQEATGRLHIAHVLDHYCCEVYGRRSFEVLNPASDLPSADALCFPALYFGPDAPPVYEDGSLTRRPDPWMRKAGAGKSLHHYKGKPEGAPYDWLRLARAMNDHRWQDHVSANEPGATDAVQSGSRDEAHPRWAA